MPTCLAFGCSNTSVNGKNKSFFRFPDAKKNRTQCIRWLHNMGNAKWNINNFVPGDRRLCSDHFHDDCFERDLKFELMPHYGKSKKKLKPGAVPTIFVYKTYDQINIDGTTVSTKQSASHKRKSTLHHEHVRNFKVKTHIISFDSICLFFNVHSTNFLFHYSLVVF